MKNSLMNKPVRKMATFFLFLSIPFSLFSQVGYFDNNPVWQINSGCAVPFPCIEYRTYNYYINGDTVFNGHTYKKMFTRGNGWFFWNDPSPVPSSCQAPPYTFNDTLTPYAYVRDTLNKIYFTGFGNPDTLLYDFNLVVGDTLPVTYNYSWNQVTVVSIDSIPVSDFYRKRFHLSLNAYTPYLIEGIGHISGFFEDLQPGFDCGYTLTCYGINDTTYYPQVNYSSCNINVGINSIEPVQPDIYPNPVNSFITISYPHAITSIDVVNMLGQTVLRFDGFNKQIFQLNLNNLNQGLYLLRVRSETSKQFILKRIIKL